MSTLGLGKLITSPQQRDAVHVAIAPVVAAEELAPGALISFVRDGDTETVRSARNGIGIVDPFLPRRVAKGQRFWMFLLPETITSLRHEWTHPAFSKPGTASAEKWLRDFADRHDFSYPEVIQAGQQFIDTGDRYVQHGSESARGEMWEEGAREEFWQNWEIVTGAKVPEVARAEGPFCCSC